jgi:hypothetical protein
VRDRVLTARRALFRTLSLWGWRTDERGAVCNHIRALFADHARLERVLRALLVAVPCCDVCGAPAPRRSASGAFALCDAHATDECPDAPGAAAVRTAAALFTPPHEEELTHV